MKMKIATVIITSIALLITGVGVLMTVRNMISEKGGDDVTAVVLNVPGDCHRRTISITVFYKNKQYRLPISTKECKAGAFGIDDVVKVRYYKPYDILTWREESTMYILLTGLLPVLALAGVYYWAEFKYGKHRR